AVQNQCAAKDIWIAAQPLLPEPMRRQQHAIAPRKSLFRHECAAGRWGTPEHLKIVVGYLARLNTQWFARSCHGQPVTLGGREDCSLGVFAPVEEVQRGDRVALSAGRLFEDHD